MRLSVVVPCLNASATIAVQLEALARQTWSGEWELILADNGSTDDTLAVARSYEHRFPDFRIVDASTRRGPAHAQNEGVRASTGEAILFCDADDKVAPNWLEAMGEALLGHDFVASRLEFRELAALTSDVRHAQEDGLNVYRYPPFLPHAGNGSLGVRRSVHDAVGGFDESMFGLFDTDYCFRVQLMGIPLYYVAETVVHVRSRKTLFGLFKQAQLNGAWNVVLYKRYRSLGMPRLSLRQGIAGWVSLLRGLPDLHDRKFRSEWLWNLGWRTGRLQGSLKHRVLAL